MDKHQYRAIQAADRRHFGDSPRAIISSPAVHRAYERFAADHHAMLATFHQHRRNIELAIHHEHRPPS